MDPRVTHALYRFWNAAGDLLYVGISVNPYGRFEQHQGDKPWWGEVANITMQPYPDRESVLTAEREAIECEHPAYNVQHNSAVTTPAYQKGYEDGMHDGQLLSAHPCRTSRVVTETHSINYPPCPDCGSFECIGWVVHNRTHDIAAETANAEVEV